jgi:exopolysaccharide biosynthesis polyprenyl glycosylphosphotransferase
MLHARISGIKLVRTLIQSCVAFFFFLFLAGLAHRYLMSLAGGLSAYIGYGILAPIGISLAQSSRRGVPYDLPAPGSRWNAFMRAVRQTAVTGLVFTVYSFLVKDRDLSRLFLGTYLGLLPGVLYLSSRHLVGPLSRFFFHHRHQTRTLLIGSPETCERYADWLASKKTVGIHVIGMVIPLVTEAELARTELPKTLYPLLGTVDDLPSLLSEHRPNSVIHLDFPGTTERTVELKIECDRVGARFLALCDLARTLSRSLSFFADDGVHVMAVRDEPLESPFNRAAKRAFDVVTSLTALTITMPPLMLLVWVLHRFQSPGPLYFRQRRVGRNHQEFLIWKFRTMHADHGDEARQASSADERVFPAGRWLRRLSLDEFPQFLNVLLGDMSIVGPRPHLAEHDEQFAKVAEAYRVRTLIKPGITGLAQVHGFRGEAHTIEDIVSRASLDISYLETWSLGLDLQIMVRTALQVLFPPRSAY